ncbi:MAG: response regulator [Rhodopseudomonas sp.]|uniref:response regulator n=1 Tax=Rhodopseudomonas sp. TaxID=1078 RepID=UPI0017F4035E|nr:response regulator [Rhodopseudomonas sp.]NVN87727.1 response regulator [Rhodopseudomonas sp.]
MSRILVVDDEPSVCASISALLSRNGYEVTTADGADTGLQALAGASFDLMIVDIFMPHMHGFEAVRIFHQRAPKVPLVAISGYAFAETDRLAPDFLSMAIELGAWRCLRKPFTSAALLFVVRECLNEAKVVDSVFSADRLELRDP